MKDRVLEILSRHMSRLHAEMTLRRAVSKVGADPELEDPRDHPQLAAVLERSLGLVGGEADMSAAIRELRAALTPDRPQSVRVELASEADMSVARQAARTLAEKVGARSFAAQRFTTAVSELARNIVQYAGSGVVELMPLAEHGRRGLRVLASDRGPGIAHLSQVLDGTYESRTGLGKGILGVRRLMDTFEIDSGADGTRIAAELHL